MYGKRAGSVGSDFSPFRTRRLSPFRRLEDAALATARSVLARRKKTSRALDIYIYPSLDTRRFLVHISSASANPARPRSRAKASEDLSLSLSLSQSCSFQKLATKRSSCAFSPAERELLSPPFQRFIKSHKVSHKTWNVSNTLERIAKAPKPPKGRARRLC